MATYKITRRQNISNDCMVCGSENPFGVKADFYELENGMLAAVVRARGEHQSYPGRVHGGMIAALLDETIGRAINITDPDCWGVTIDLQVRYKKPVPYGTELTVTGVITRNRSRTFEGKGTLYLPDGTAAATASGVYMRLPADKITDADIHAFGWRAPELGNLTTITLPL